ncbi:hypothetical protein LTR28_000325 [Elasticomyces elasticus]|nr:hypothetical protein LTR28_000325 [Elasticomyces elasticus]
MQQVAVLLNVTEQAEQAEQALLDEPITSGPRATVACQALANEETSIGKQPALAKRVGNTDEEPFEVGNSCRSIRTIFTHSLTGPPASDNEAGATGQFVTAAATHVKKSYVILQNDANDADSLPKARSCKHDKSTHELDAHTGTAGNSKNTTGIPVNEGSPLQGQPSLLQERQTPVPNANRPEAAHGNGSTDPGQVYNTVGVTGEKQLQTESRDDDLANRLHRKVLEHPRHQRLLQQVIRTSEECLPRMKQGEQRILSGQRALVSMRAQAELLQNKTKENTENVDGMSSSLGRGTALWRLSGEETAIEKRLALEKQIRNQRIRQEQMTIMQRKVSNQRFTNRQNETSDSGQGTSETSSWGADDVALPPAAAKRVAESQATEEYYATVA